jgi:hypothetical protein
MTCHCIGMSIDHAATKTLPPCTKCGKPAFGFSVELCKSCERKDFWQNRWKGRTYELPAALHIDNQATFDLLGYYATSVGPGDHKKVVFTCKDCGRKIKRVRRNIRPDDVCHPCAKVRMWEEWKPQLLQRRNDTIMRNGFADLVTNTASTHSAEDKFAAFIASFGFDVQREMPIQVYTRNGRQKTDLATVQFIDIVVPSKMIAFEYNGLMFHHEHSKTERPQWYHYDKMQAAEALGYQVINVFEDEWLTRRHQVENVIRTKLGIIDTVVGARECRVESIDTGRAKTFINEHHVQELDKRPKAAWGLFYDARLLGVLTLTHDKKGRKKIAILNRLCFAGGVRIVGGASKLLQPAVLWAKEHGYNRILSWSDNRWSDGGVYTATGFKMTRDGTPDYAYVVIDKPRKRIQRENLQKSKTGCPTDVFEEVWNFEKLKMARIWDCGHKRWELTL